MKIRSPLINRAIDKADRAITLLSKLLPPDKPTRLRIGRRPITQLEIGVVTIALLMAAGFGWYYGHWQMALVFMGVFVMMGIWMW